jgi:hypothetical protein
VSVPPTTHSAASEVGAANPAAVEPAAMKASTPETTASTAAGKSVIGNKAGGHKNHCSEASESIPKHGHSSLLISGNSIGAFRLACRFDMPFAKRRLGQLAALRL